MESATSSARLVSLPRLTLEEFFDQGDNIESNKCKKAIV